MAAIAEHIVKPFDLEAIRAEFPILSSLANGKPLVYLDNGASAQKPLQVIEATSEYYRKYNANVHRGVHYLSDQATRAYEQARELCQSFINAEKRHEVIYTKGTTDGINLVASSFGQAFLQPGDEILISEMEHHANIVPWQMVAKRMGAKVLAVAITENGELDMADFHAKLGPKTKIVAMSHVSNTLGTINPVEEIISAAHAKGVPVLLDGAQAIPHLRVDVQKLDVDFYVFSGHKMFGPTGVGILYGKEKWLDAMPPYQGGGDMIDKVTIEETTYNALPHKFEAGTPNIAGFAGFAAAFEYLFALDHRAAFAHEQALLAYATQRLKEIPGLRIVGEAKEKVAVISFVVGDIHHSDLGTLLDNKGIALRTGHHCTQPLMQRYGLKGTLRASFAFYNTKEEVDLLAEGLKRAIKMFQ